MSIKFDSGILYVRDIEKAKSFYIDKLGFVLDYDDGNYVSLKTTKDDTTKVALNAEGKSGHFPGHQTIVLKTDKIDKVYKKYKEKKVPIKKELTQKSWGKTFTISDVDGNKIEILEV